MKAGQAAQTLHWEAKEISNIHLRAVFRTLLQSKISRTCCNCSLLWADSRAVIAASPGTGRSCCGSPRDKFPTFQFL